MKKTLPLLLSGILLLALVFGGFFLYKGQQKMPLLKGTTQVTKSGSNVGSGIKEPALGNSGSTTSTDGSGELEIRFKGLVDKFDKIKDKQGFNDFYEMVQNNQYAILSYFLKSHKKDAWEKYFTYLYDKLLETSGGKKDLVGGYDKKGFVTFTNTLYDDIEKGITTLTTEDKKMDMKVYFSALPLNEVLKECETLSQTVDMYKNGKTACQDAVYMYRATNENGYCDLITSDGDKQNCKDILLLK